MSKQTRREPGATPDRMELHRRMKAITDAGIIGRLPRPALVVLHHVAVHAGFADCLVSIGAQAVATLNNEHRTTIRRGVNMMRRAGMIKMRRRPTRSRAAVYELVVPKGAQRVGTGCAHSGHTVCPPRAQGVPTQGTGCAHIHVPHVPHVSHEEQGGGMRDVAGGDTRSPAGGTERDRRLRSAAIKGRGRA